MSKLVQNLFASLVLHDNMGSTGKWEEHVFILQIKPEHQKNDTFRDLSVKGESPVGLCVG